MRYTASACGFLILAMSSAPVVSAMPGANLSGNYAIYDSDTGAQIDVWNIVPLCEPLAPGCTAVVRGKNIAGVARWVTADDWEMAIPGPVPICGPGGGLANGLIIFRWDAQTLHGTSQSTGADDASGVCHSGNRPAEQYINLALSPAS